MVLMIAVLRILDDYVAIYFLFFLEIQNRQFCIYASENFLYF